MSPRRSSAPSRIRGTRPSQRLLAALAVLLFLSGSAAVLSAATFTDTTAGQVTVSAAEDFSPPTADLAVPAQVSGTVPLTVDARDDRTFVTEVVIEKRPAGGSWTTVCTITSAPWTCDWNTLGTPDGDVSLRATATDSVGLTGTSSVVTTLVDNTAPTASLTLPSPISGEITVAPVVSDAGSGVASVIVDYRTGTGAWINLCSRSSAPYTCTLDTTNLTTGATYTFRVTVVDAAGNQATVSATATVDNTTASIGITSPVAGGFVRGETQIAVDATTSPGTVGSVVVQQRRDETDAWSTICTDTTAPYTCQWNVGGAVPPGAYELQAVMTYGPDNRTLASEVVTPVYVDNTPPYAFDVQAIPGGTPGTLDAGDSFVFTYSTLIDLATIAPGLTVDGPGVTGVSSTLYGKNAAGSPVDKQDWLNIPGLGRVAFSQDLIVPSKSATTPMTLTATTDWDLNGLPRTRITATAGAFTGDRTRSGVGPGTMTWGPATATATRTTDNLPLSTTNAVETGPADPDQ